MSIDETSVFHVEESNTARIRKTLKEVYDALEERGYLKSFKGIVNALFRTRSW